MLNKSKYSCHGLPLKPNSVPASGADVIGMDIGRAIYRIILSVTILTTSLGCFQEKSFPMRPGDVVRIQIDSSTKSRDKHTHSVRQWLKHAHQQIKHLLPNKAHLAMVTEDLLDEKGEPRDIYKHFMKNPAELDILLRNYWAMLHTAQCAGPSVSIEKPSPPWPGFKQVWIPVDEDIELSGWLGFARKNGRVRSADCIVLLPGMWGDNAIKRTTDLAKALFQAGYHVLALELRGHGQTEVRYPTVHYNFGVLETRDLMKVSEWLEDHQYINRTGIVAFCWGGNHGLLAAWYDGRKPNDPSISEDLQRILEPKSDRRHFTAGVIAFSPVLRWEEVVDHTDIPRAVLDDPATYFYQWTLRERTRRKGYPVANGNLRQIINFEFAHSVLTSSFGIIDAYDLLRFLPYRGRPSGRKLEHSRIPVLLVQAANDPFLCAQDIADLMAETSNPNVAALLISGGGHIGFAAFARSYYYSLIINFFDPQNGVAAFADKNSNSG
ncbi:MAG: alpha/beta fold hydrolase [Planctomycetota bacterium]|nr:MAG: alpha/beta fold hydrolase [Planctomycetota bacterium]